MANHNPGWHGPEETRFKPPRKDECVHGHDLTDDDNVMITRRKRGGKVYPERQCRPCYRARSKRWRDSKKVKR